MDGIAIELVGGIDTAFSTASTPNQHENKDISVEAIETEATSHIAVKAEPIATCNDSDEMKRAHAKQLIEKYFYQLSDGCGNPNCTNRNCASSGEVNPLTPNEAAARAIQLFSEEAPLCGMPSAKSSRIATNDESASVLVNSNASNAVTDNTNDAYR